MSERTISIGFKVEDGVNGFRNLILNADDLRKALSATVVQAQGLNKSIINFSQLAQGMEAIKSALSGLSGAIEACTGDAKPFADAMQATNTMAGRDAAGLESLKDEVTTLAQRVPVARDVLANGLYQVISNGVPEDNWISFLEASSRSAVGGIADLGKIVGVTSTVIKNYGMSWEDAEAIQDKIQLTAKNGVTSFEQLAASLPKVTANAATLGMSIDELMATFATLTGVSGNTAEVATQLAAVMTALVKPSSEAVKIAAQMGVQFDAAAVKAAGGFQQFLSSLDTSVKAYAASSGVLEQEIYAKLFGSAEALRALIPLNGELADKFAVNISEMQNSAGTMIAAFEDMSKTGEATAQSLKNRFVNLFDAINNAVTPFKSFFDVIEIVTQFVAGIRTVTAAVNTLNLAFLKTISLKVGAYLIGLTKYLSSATARTHGFDVAVRSAAISVRKLSLAVGGFAGLGVSWIIWKLVKSLSTYNSEALRSVALEKDLSTIRTSAAKQLIDQRQKIDLLVAAAENESLALEERRKAISKLNSIIPDYNATLDETSGKYQANTKALQIYISELKKLYEIEGAKDLLKEIGHRKVEIRDEIETIHRESQPAKQQSSESRVVTTSGGGYPGSVLALMGKSANTEATQQRLRKLNQELSTLDQREQSITKNYGTEIQRQAINSEAGSIANTGRNLNKNKGKHKTVEPPPPEGSIKYKEEQIRNLKTKFEVEVDPSERQKLVAEMEKLQDEVDRMRHDAKRPDVIRTFEEIDYEINYQRTLRQKATAENIAGIDAEIKKLEEQREYLESSTAVTIPVEEIKTYEQLSRELSRYRAMLDKTDSSQRDTIQASINKLEELKKSWDNALEELKKPGDVSALDTIEELDNAIAYYQQAQKRASVDEIANIQRTVQAYQKKRDALQRGIEIPSMLREAGEINSLTGKEYRTKISGLGFDTLTSKISELKRLLEDLENPVTAGQRRDIEGLISIYERWRRESVSVFDTYRSGWNNLKGIGDGISGITDALRGNGDAWRTVTGIVDGALQIYDGVRGIVALIDMLRVVTVAHTSAKTAESAAIGMATGAQAAEAVAAEGAAAAQLPVIAANKLATASYMELAASSFFAAHAAIPFAGFGIAAGFSTAAVSMVEAIGVTPFAEGGVVSGPTVGLIGEYAGATRNPEVVAPLDRLRGMIADVVSPTHTETDSSERIISRLSDTVRTLESVSRTVQHSLESVSETFRSFETVRQSVMVPVMTYTGAGLEAVAASVPHFASGGVVYGPTLGVMGEYAGAGSNPEVVAPLDRLRGLISDSTGAGDVTPRNVTFTIEGSRLVGVIENYMRVAGRSGRRFNF